jgi:Uma2 family endonuclease
MAIVTTQPAGSDSGVTMSLEEWAEMPEDEPGELVDGVLTEEEMPGPVHECVVTWLVVEVGSWGRGRGVLVLGSNAKYRVSATRGRMPDVAVYLPGTPKPTRDALIRVPPSIAVEIVSSTPRDTRRDRVEKLAEYAAFGVRWYWIVDPQTRIFEIHELGTDGRYVSAVAVVGGRVDPVPGCNGLALDVDALWREVDALPEAT